MNLIRKSNFNIIDYTTSVSCKEYLIISDELISEIESKFYDTGLLDENNEPILVDLKLIDSIVELESENLFNEVISITYKNRDNAIQDYENKKINDSYFGFKNHLEVYDLVALLLIVPSLDIRLSEMKAADGKLARYIETVIQNPATLKFRTNVNLFIDNIEIAGLDQLLLLTVKNELGEDVPAVIKHNENPVWTLL